MSDISKIALITGANKGVGFEIARQLGAQGIIILAGVRDQARGEAAVQRLRSEGINASVVLLDVTIQITIDAAVTCIEQTDGKLDILVNNAGIHVELSESEESTLPSQLTLEELCKTFETNVFGVFATTCAMLPLLRRSEAGRIVNLSSEMGSMTMRSDTTSAIAPYPPSLAYDASKAAANSLTVSLANELRNTLIKVNSASPGYTSMDMNHHRGFQTPEQGARVPVAVATLPADGPTGCFFWAPRGGPLVNTGVRSPKALLGFRVQGEHS